ncbi:MAG: thioredoxin reductase [Thermoprotei archaeon]|nr:MAG: thioredoxin reductase [Thermoprotei archaeon]
MSLRISFKGLGLVEKPKEKEYDVVIVGGGPAGVTAAIYSARYMLKTLIITKEKGGQLNKVGYIENYPGIRRIIGPEFIDKLYRHLEYYKVPVIIDEVVDIKKRGDEMFDVLTSLGERFTSKTVILALGVMKRKLGVPGEEEFLGKGVSYCAPCDAPLFRDKMVAVIGGGDSAASAALLLAEYAKKVYVVYRRDRLRAQPFYIRQLKENPKVEFILNSNVAEIGGTKTVEWIKIRETGKKIPVNGVFIEIGADPPRKFFEKIGVEVNEKGYVKVGRDQSTNIPGIFAAGDCTNAAGAFKQIVVAAAQGAIAADSAYRYIVEKFK